MLETVTKGFRAAKNRLAGKVEITPEMIDESLRDIRVSLLEADVAFEVVKKFVAQVREKAAGEVVKTSITDKKGRTMKVSPADQFIKICHDELENLMGPVDTSLKFAPKGQISGLMMVGLQGSGKTTAVAKLANLLLKQEKQPLLVAADIYRPAAVEQLKVLGAQLQVPVFFEPNLSPPELAKQGYAAARSQKRDVVLIDTAGRLAINEELMAELEAIKAAVHPENTLLVCDAMIGQDAVRTAAEFDRRLNLDGFILTKLDGDARGGAALSIKEVTGKPIKFLGMGESLDKLEGLRGGRRRREGRGRREEAALRELHDARLRRPDPHRAQDGSAQGPAGEVSDFRRDDRTAESGRERAHQNRGDVRLDDRAGAASPGAFGRAPDGPCRQGLWPEKVRGERAAPKVHDDASSDGVDRRQSRVARPDSRVSTVGTVAQAQRLGSLHRVRQGREDDGEGARR